MFLILRTPVYCMINIQICFLLNILCSTKQVRVKCFLEYFLLFIIIIINIIIFFFLCLSSNFEVPFLLSSQLLKHQWELHLEKKKVIYLEIKNILVTIMYYPDSIYSFEVNGNTRIICEILTKLTTKHTRMTSMTAGFKLLLCYIYSVAFSC